MQRYDVIVVGAGPAGATAATTAARHGAKVLLLEEHTQIGRPIQCTGLLSLRGWRLARVSDSIIVRAITGVRVHSPDSSVYELGGDRVRAYVIDRDRFDQSLVERAAQCGVAVQTGVRAVELGEYRNGERTLVAQIPDGARQTYQAAVIIGADGPHSVLAQHAGLPRPKKILLGLQAVIAVGANGCSPPDFVEVFFGKRWAANFFAWSVPAVEGTARVGVATDLISEAKACFERLHREHHNSGKILAYQSGMIPIGPAERTVADGFLIVGDAAGQAKPTSGGGIYTGMLCGRIAGEVAARCALTGKTQARFLREYERRWRAKLERELSLGLRAHQILTQLSDEQIAHALKLLALPALRKLIERVGDIDYPSKIAQELLKRPRLWGVIWPVVPTGLVQYVKSVAMAAKMLYTHRERGNALIMHDLSSWTLAEREQKSLEILRQAFAEFGSEMAVAFTGGKDSLVVLDLVRRAGNGHVPIPVLHIDTTVDFPEVYEYRDRLAREWGLQLIIYQNREALVEAPPTDDPKFCIFCTKRLKTEALNQAIQKYKWRALITGVRWDEHQARSQETYFSPRPDHVRVHPILHFRERDVWEYIKKYQLPYCPLYDKGYRSLGCVPCTKPVSDISVPERAGRGTDKEGLMERLRALGYF